MPLETTLRKDMLDNEAVEGNGEISGNWKPGTDSGMEVNLATTSMIVPDGNDGNIAL